MTTTAKAALLFLSITAAFAVGRFTTPAKTVEIEKKTDAKESDTERDKHKTTTTTETTAPDGTKTKTTTTTEDSTTTKKTTEVATDDKTKEVIYNTPKVTVYALAGFNKNGPVYGGGIMKQFLGPISLGLYGTTEISGGITLGLTF